MEHRQYHDCYVQANRRPCLDSLSCILVYARAFNEATALRYVVAAVNEECERVHEDSVLTQHNDRTV